jgi:hypothetical protein
MNNDWERNWKEAVVVAKVLKELRKTEKDRKIQGVRIDI